MIYATMFDRTILLPNGRGSCSRRRFPRTPGGTKISPGWTATRNGRTGWTGPVSTTSRPVRTRSTRITPRSVRRSWPRSRRRPPMSCWRSRPPPPGRAAGFGPGMPLDVLPGCAQLAVAADSAAQDGFAGVSEAELVGVLCAWDRVEAHTHARKLAATAELARRNPKPEDAEFTADQVAYALGESRGRAGVLIDLAQ